MSKKKKRLSIFRLIWLLFFFFFLFLSYVQAEVLESIIMSVILVLVISYILLNVSWAFGRGAKTKFAVMPVVRHLEDMN